MVEQSSETLRDLPRFQEIASARHVMRLMGLLRRLTRPAVWLLRRDLEEFDSKTADWQRMEQQAADLTSVPDRFNKCFGPRGWIMYEMMNFDLAKTCVQKAENGDIDSAEQDLVAHYDPDQIRLLLQWMNAIRAFRMRTPLAEKALADYAAGRYYASILVTLSLLDGLVNDLHERQVGFFSKDLQLEAWDSLSAHSTGLGRLSDLLQTRRQKTTQESITIPYRHGIVHGRDLGYDSQIVAAKSWAALFSIREWALKAERNDLKPPPPKPQVTLKETFYGLIGTLNENEKVREALEAWTPRRVQVGIDLPRFGTPSDYEPGTPEQKVAEFFHCLMRNNYGGLLGCLDRMYSEGATTKRAAGDLRKRFRNLLVDRYELTNVHDDAAALSTVGVVVHVQCDSVPFEQMLELRLAYGTEKDRSLPRGAKGVNGDWSLCQIYPSDPPIGSNERQSAASGQALRHRQHPLRNDSHRDAEASLATSSCFSIVEDPR